MNRSSYSLTILATILVTNTLLADTTVITSTSNTTNKEIYNFKSENGTPVFTDSKPKNLKFDTKTITTTKPIHENRIDNLAAPILRNNTEIRNSTTIIHQYDSQPKKEKRRKTSKKRCEYFKNRLELVNDKMKSGYKPSEYKRLEKERIKYRNLVFNKCDSRVN